MPASLTLVSTTAGTLPMTDTTTNQAARPDFGTLIPNPAARMLVELAYDAHQAYCSAHFSRYGVESAGLKAWREALNTDATVEALTDLPAFSAIDEIARLSESPEMVAALIVVLTDTLASAKANLAGLYSTRNRTDGQTASDPDADPVALRDNLDSMLAACIPLASTPMLDSDALWSVFPHRTVKSKSGSTRVVYDGPRIPTTRNVSPLRANARLTLVTHKPDGSTTVHDDVNFGDSVKRELRADMSELREMTGGFTADTLGSTDPVIFERNTGAPNGEVVRFSIVKRDIN